MDFDLTTVGVSMRSYNRNTDAWQPACTYDTRSPFVTFPNWLLASKGIGEASREDHSHMMSHLMTGGDLLNDLGKKGCNIGCSHLVPALTNTWLNSECSGLNCGVELLTGTASFPLRDDRKAFSKCHCWISSLSH